MRMADTARTLLAAIVASLAPVGASYASDTQAAVAAQPVAATAPSMPTASSTVPAQLPVGQASAGLDKQPASTASTTPASANAAGYVPKTKYDNTPYRFNAGKKFSAAEFDAWMRSRGIRVAKGTPAAEAPAAASASVSGGEGQVAPTNCATGAVVTAC